MDTYDFMNELNVYNQGLADYNSQLDSTKDVVKQLQQGEIKEAISEVSVPAGGLIAGASLKSAGGQALLKNIGKRLGLDDDDTELFANNVADLNIDEAGAQVLTNIGGRVRNLGNRLFNRNENAGDDDAVDPADEPLQMEPIPRNELDNQAPEQQANNEADEDQQEYYDAEDNEFEDMGMNEALGQDTAGQNLRSEAFRDNNANQAEDNVGEAGDDLAGDVGADAAADVGADVAADAGIAGAEAVGAGLDATGILAPLGIIVGVGAALSGLFTSIFHHHHHDKVPVPNLSVPVKNEIEQA